MYYTLSLVCAPLGGKPRGTLMMARLQPPVCSKKTFDHPFASVFSKCPCALLGFKAKFESPENNLEFIN